MRDDNPIENVRTETVQNALDLHNEASGDSWGLDKEDEHDIQHRITLIAKFSNYMEIRDNVMYYGC